MKQYDDGLEDEDEGSHKEGVYLGEEDKVEDQGKSTNVDYVECIVQKILRVGASHPIFPLDSEDADHDVLEPDQLSAGPLTEPSQGPKRVT